MVVTLRDRRVWLVRLSDGLVRLLLSEACDAEEGARGPVGLYPEALTSCSGLLAMARRLRRRGSVSKQAQL